jgi:hypothetical protein
MHPKPNTLNDERAGQLLELQAPHKQKLQYSPESELAGTNKNSNTPQKALQPAQTTPHAVTSGTHSVKRTFELQDILHIDSSGFEALQILICKRQISSEWNDLSTGTTT